MATRRSNTAPARSNSPRAEKATDAADALDRIVGSASEGKLVAVIGTGVSIGLTNNQIAAVSWKGLVLDGFRYGVKKGLVTGNQLQVAQLQLASDDLDDLLAAADFMSRKLDAPNGDLYGRWLERVFKDLKPSNRTLERAISALHAARIPLCTLNYDPLLERISGLPPVTLNETGKVTAWFRRESHGDGILHLHGVWDAPSTCVLGVRDYDKTLSNDVRDLIQRSLGTFRRLLFIGCGDTFADPNLSALIKWLRRHLGTGAPEHYALVTDDEVAERHADVTWQGFVEPLGYGKSHGELAGFLLDQFGRLSKPLARKKASTSRVAAPSSARHDRLLNDYRAFLVKDCGQMTIEGLHADMDTAQRRFDLERLFVPIRVLLSPPVISANDPKREEKLRRWRAEHDEEQAFGAAFGRYEHMVLLALPGGGKSLLLKRLAVAYADPSRREASSDKLPELELTPVMIRCREWREHIHRPILTLLDNLPAITGQPSLVGLRQALLPLLKKGRILLLVDGLDEIHDDGLRTVFIEHLERFLTEYRLTRAVMTSREAGFGLVAPSLARFCTQARIAPLTSGDIRSLCALWHRLIMGDSAEVQAEAGEVSDLLVRNTSLRRLAENPLLLTMLLVVKHGAGRLPPDRVTLYARAVEVLLDTWNIRGHDPLSPKEAVPQLAWVALQLMKAGKQTATASELLSLLEEARDNIPQIRRYAKDTPEQFLKRVELRSSLLVEAGHQIESGGPMPFYQFRHLTFQEYLAAYAAVHGIYLGYDKVDTVLTPLQSQLTAAEWKEVIPMSAVLAGKHAQPLIDALVQAGAALREQNAGFEQERVLPPPVARIAQCLVEEAEASHETLTAALQLLAWYCRGGSSSDDWRALSRGPYGEELLHQSWLLYEPMQWEERAWMDSTCAALAILQKPEAFWASDEGQAEIRRRLKSEDREVVGLALLTCAGLRWFSQYWGTALDAVTSEKLPLAEIQTHLFSDDPAIWHAAVWASTMIHSTLTEPPPLPRKVLDRRLELWLANLGKTPHGLATPFGLKDLPIFPRQQWTPQLTPSQIDLVRRTMKVGLNEMRPERPDSFAACRVAFHAGRVSSAKELVSRLVPWKRFGNDHVLDGMLQQLGVAGRKYLPKPARPPSKPARRRSKPRQSKRARR